MVRTQFDERHAQLGDELRLKLRLFEYESRPTTAFATGDYLRRKAMIVLGDDDASPAGETRGRKTRAPKPPKTPKEQKVPSHRISHEMFTSGMSMERIAAERHLAPGTIFGHLAVYVENGSLPIDQIVSQDHIDAIRNFARLHPQGVSTNDIKNAIDDSITYNEIMLVKKIYDIKEP